MHAQNPGTKKLKIFFFDVNLNEDAKENIKDLVDREAEELWSIEVYLMTVMILHAIAIFIGFLKKHEVDLNDDKKQNIKELLEVVPNKRTNKRDITQAYACISEDNVGGSFRMDYTVGWLILLDGLFCLALTKERSPVPFYLFKKLTLAQP